MEAKAVAAHRWVPLVARPVKEPSVAAARAATVAAVAAATAVEAVAAAVAVAAFGASQSEQPVASWAPAAREVGATVEVGVAVVGAEVEVRGRVNRAREDAEATGQGSMATAAGATATVAVATVVVARVVAARARVVLAGASVAKVVSDRRVAARRPGRLSASSAERGAAGA